MTTRSLWMHSRVVRRVVGTVGLGAPVMATSPRLDFGSDWRAAHPAHARSGSQQASSGSAKPRRAERLSDILTCTTPARGASESLGPTQSPSVRWWKLAGHRVTMSFRRQRSRLSVRVDLRDTRCVCDHWCPLVGRAAARQIHLRGNPVAPFARQPARAAAPGRDRSSLGHRRFTRRRGSPNSNAGAPIYR